MRLANGIATRKTQTKEDLLAGICKSIGSIQKLVETKTVIRNGGIMENKHHQYVSE